MCPCGLPARSGRRGPDLHRGPSARSYIMASHNKAPAPRVAILYSGRIFGGDLIASWASNHLETLIKPNSANVFVVSDPTTWCSAPNGARAAWRAGRWTIAEDLLRAQVSALFHHYPKLHVALASTGDLYAPHAWGKAAVEAMRRQNVGKADRAAIFIHKWYSQYDHYAKAEALRLAHGPHDVRARAWLRSHTHRTHALPSPHKPPCEPHLCHTRSCKNAAAAMDACCRSWSCACVSTSRWSSISSSAAFTRRPPREPSTRLS